MRVSKITKLPRGPWWELVVELEEELVEEHEEGDKEEHEEAEEDPASAQGQVKHSL